MGEDQADTQPEACDVVFGSPLPAHLIAICGGSPRFSAQWKRWIQEKGSGCRPELRVPLGGEDEVPHALSALRFIYTGKLDVSGACALLGVRRLAAYLQVEGCVAACDAALLDLVTRKAEKPGDGGVLAGVAELYGSRQLLPDPEDEPHVVRVLLLACQQQLVKHSATADSKGPMSAGGPSLGELLSWAFVDAPSLLSDPGMRKHMEALPAAAMEALLGSDSLATDDEATVLVMLACWLEANPATPAATRQQLCKLVRLSQLSSTYLLVVLPAIPWFPITVEEHRFLCDYAHAPASKRMALAKMMKQFKYDASSAWYASPPRPAPRFTAGRAYGWFVKEADLVATIAGKEDATRLHCKFENGATAVVSSGFEWYAGVQYARGKDTAGLYLYCSPSASLRLTNPYMLAVMVSPGDADLILYEWHNADGTRTESDSTSFSTDTFVQLMRGWGNPDAVKLDTAPPADCKQPGDPGISAAPPGPLAPRASFLHDGKISGVLAWR